MTNCDSNINSYNNVVQMYLTRLNFLVIIVYSAWQYIRAPPAPSPTTRNKTLPAAHPPRPGRR